MKALRKIWLLATCFLYLGNACAQTEATFYTSMGNFTVELTDKLTPVTVDSFIARVSDKFYDGLTFHRVIDNFMIQGGDPNGNGTGGPGYTIPDEFDPTLKNVPKALAMANAGPNTGGCQFFINLVTNSHLNNKHTVFGMVTTGFPVVQAIGKVPTDANDRPVTAVIIDSIRITKFPASVKDAMPAIALSIYPNPANGVFTISLPTIPTVVEIVNLAGQVVYQATGQGILQADLRSQRAGVYSIRIVNAEGATETRLVIE